MSKKKRFVATLQSDPTILRFVNSHDAPRLAELGTSCPDHFLRTKIKPLYVAWDPQKESFEGLKAKLTAGLEQYRKDYAAYYERCKHHNSPAMRDPNPTVILIPGIGMIAFGKDKSESRVTAEFYNCAVEVMRGAEAIDEYIALPQQEAFDIEYWLLEEAKLKRMPPEKELARNVVIVVGAGNGIGRAVAHRVAKEGAHVVCADLDKAAAEATAKELTKIYGVGIGVAGTGISGCGPAIGVAVNITNRASVREMLKQAVLAYGGVDNIVVTAGVYVAPDRAGHVTDDQWKLTFDVNVMGGYLVGDEVSPRFRAPGIARKPGDHHQRQRRRREKGFARLRCVEGRGESSGARPCGRIIAARARERARARHGGRGIDDVPPRSRDRLASEIVRDSVRGNGKG